MNGTLDRLDLSPPETGHWSGPMGIALLVHGLLVLALTWGISWKQDTETVVMGAELWSTLPQVAAPRANEPEPPAPEPVEQPPAPPEKPAPPTPPKAAETKDAQIALQKRKEEEKARKEAQETRERLAKKAADDRKKREAEAAKKLADKKLAEQKAADDKRKAQETQKKNEALQKAADAKAQAQMEAERKRNLERMMGQAGATGGANSSGTAQRDSGPSANYAGKLVARIKPNIVFTDTVSGNPRAEVEVRSLPDGTVLGSRLTQSSGNKAWDDAVLRAIERTGKLPLDEKGRVPGTLLLGFRPQD
ncbi:MAG: hypothetical protein RL323_1494 [Pseudomonadota bacterium]|jgi:colicin import membrane protein